VLVSRDLQGSSRFFELKRTGLGDTLLETIQIFVKPVGDELTAQKRNYHQEFSVSAQGNPNRLHKLRLPEIAGEFIPPALCHCYGRCIRPNFSSMLRSRSTTWLTFQYQSTITRHMRKITMIANALLRFQ
jgi:hypothetical protein